VVLNSGLQLAGVGGSVQNGLLGAVLVVSVLLNNLVLNRKPPR
jgi:ribose/xylose/arabinose/galactoside ABC-type transport system permease subunit